MPTSIILPRVDMDMETGRIARWLVASGAAVNQGDPLFEIETDKATMEIEAPASGTVHIFAEASDAAIKVASVVGEIRAPGEVAQAPPAPPTVPAEPVPNVAPTPAPNPAPPLSLVPDVADAPTMLRATPLARRQATLRGIDLRTLTGSGPRGRVLSRDIDRQNTAHAAPPPPASRHTNAIGETIVYLHGFASNAASWAPLRARCETDLPQLAIDLPGHGRTAPLASATIAAMAAAVLAEIRQATTGPVHLVGHSLGGALAARLAGSGLLDVRSLLLIAPVGLGPEIDHDFIAGLLRARSEAGLRPWLHRLVSDPALIGRGMASAVLALTADHATASFLTALAADAFPDGTQSADWMFDAAALPMPTRIVFGRADRIIPSAQAARIDGAAGVSVLNGIGHMPQIEAVGMLARIHREVISAAAMATNAADRTALSSPAHPRTGT
ncbi:MAG: acetoin dehydrogenase dihydrolipoyllysine-residue acetyltransferase subunit [Proteobacteria bacterium]|nr:acetoin dehydrogenase dihydrolipoyllysine-residue acetyltransferase subunit [Pseudomonadota bacterium]